jgi:uncharacterized SAM-binding protein YcdF (DUF218 family)
MLSTVLLLLAAASVVVAIRLRPRKRSQRRRFWAVVATAVVLVLVWAVTSDPFDVRKVLGALAMPVGLIWLGMLALAWHLSAGRERRLGRAAWGIWIAFTLAGNVWVGQALMSWLEEPYSGIDPFELSSFDAILVLAGGVYCHDDGSVYLAESGDRLMLGARLFLRGKTTLLLTSGPEVDCGRGAATTVPRITARVWQDLGIPAEQILLLEGPRSTSEEIAELGRLLEQHSWQRVGLITSASHLRRSLGLCRRAGIVVTPLPADFASSSIPLRPVQLIPQSDGFRTVQKACWEILGAAVGR